METATQYQDRVFGYPTVASGRRAERDRLRRACVPGTTFHLGP